MSEGRALTAEDLFDPATKWWTRLVPAMLETAYEEKVHDVIKGYESLQRSQTPRIETKGVSLMFHEDGYGSSFVLAQPIFLPWRTVRPYLRKRLPFDPTQLKTRSSGWEGCESWRSNG